MSSATVITTQRHTAGSLDWEVRDLNLHFRFCAPCSLGAQHYCSMVLESAVMEIAEDDGNSTKWQLQCGRNCTKEYSRTFGDTNFNIYLCLNGMFDESKSEDSGRMFEYMYAVTVFGGSSDNMKKIIGNSDKKSLFTKGNKVLVANVCSLSTFFDPKKEIWPNGNLKITVKLFRLLGVNHEVLDLSQNDKIFKQSSTNPIGQLLNNPRLSDVKILCGDSLFYAHKLILSVQSRVFCTMFEAKMLESKSNEVKITDLKPETVEMMLKYFYTGEIIIPPTHKDVLELLDCAEKYELEELKLACLKKMTLSLTDHNVGEFAIAADLYNAGPSALAVIKDYCMKNHERLMGNAEYKKMFLANPQAFIR